MSVHDCVAASHAMLNGQTPMHSHHDPELDALSTKLIADEKGDPGALGASAPPLPPPPLLLLLLLLLLLRVAATSSTAACSK